MKRYIISLVTIGLLLFCSGCTNNNPITPETNQNDEVVNTLDKKFASVLVGEMALNFDFNRAPYFWEGTVKFRGNGVCGIRFESLGAPIDYGTLTYFVENYEIFELGKVENIYLRGPDVGIIINESSKVISYGTVIEANAPFAMWLSAEFNTTGFVNFGEGGVPLSFEGTLRLFQ